MPFSDDIDNNQRESIIKMHSRMQIGATLFMTGNIHTTFAPLLAIQLAALLMTLVRKNIINSKQWHQIYSLSLWLSILSLPSCSVEYIMAILVIYRLFNYIRIKKQFNKYISWLICFTILIVIKKIIIGILINNFYISSILIIQRIISDFVIIVFFIEMYFDHKNLFY